MMAINVTQKDETLHEIIAWADQAGKVAYEKSKLCSLEHDDEGLTWHDGRATAYQEVIRYCESKLGYSGSMTDEVPNQSEDARQETGNA